LIAKHLNLQKKFDLDNKSLEELFFKLKEVKKGDSREEEEDRDRF